MKLHGFICRITVSAYLLLAWNYFPAWADDIQEVIVNPKLPRSGELFVVNVMTSNTISAVWLDIQDQRGESVGSFRAVRTRAPPFLIWTIYGGLSADWKGSDVTLRVGSSGAGGSYFRSIKMKVLQRNYRGEIIPFTSDKSNLKIRPDRRKNDESRILTALLAGFDTNDSILATNFRPPLNTLRKTSFFGDRRVYEYADGTTETTLHYGIDLGGDRLPVFACGDGIVVFAAPRIVTGNTVVIKHASGLFSLYFHMTSIIVSSGTPVRAGANIGFTGMTGLATGPHLHWELRSQLTALDPDSFLINDNLDTMNLADVALLPLFP